MVREIEEVDGASVEEVRIVDRFPDPRLDALESAASLCAAESIEELHQILVGHIRAEFLGHWSALVIDASVLASSGDVADRGRMLEALAAGTAASPMVADGSTGPDDLAVAALPSTRRRCSSDATATRSASASDCSSWRSRAIADRAWRAPWGTATRPHDRRLPGAPTNSVVLRPDMFWSKSTRRGGEEFGDCSSARKSGRIWFTSAGFSRGDACRHAGMIASSRVGDHGGDRRGSARA